MRSTPVAFMDKYVKHAWKCYHTVAEVARHIDNMMSKIAQHYGLL